MALISCYECGKELSSSAPACPNCGAPNHQQVAPREVVAEKSISAFGMVIALIGFGWALLGLGNIAAMFDGTVGDGLILFGTIFNMVLFVLPGLGVGVLGTRMRK